MSYHYQPKRVHKIERQQRALWRRLRDVDLVMSVVTMSVLVIFVGYVVWILAVR